METFLLFCIALFLAYANGANDNAKGVATLYGAGVLAYRPAIALATGATFAGGLAALVLAQGLLAGFSGKGLVGAQIAATAPFVAAVGLGAAGTVLLATRLGLPVSTTHGLVGALLGAGLMAPGPVAWSHLGQVFLLPLLLSPFLAGGLGMLTYRLHGRLAGGHARPDCMCLDEEAALPDPQTRLWRGATLRLWTGRRVDCEGRPGGHRRLAIPPLGDGLHLLSATAVSFGRGLNDTPKIAALLAVAQGVGSAWGVTAVAAGMALGGLLSARRVGETLGRCVTTLDRRQGLAASLSTAALLLPASGLALPVSTTHVSVGALFGTALAGGGARMAVVREILLAWLLTLPLALILSAAAYALVSTTGIAR